ncbi:DNA repair protein RadC [Corallococcus sp. CA049B]|uniref:RadC family protein n=1 Tax=Corallococcus sp. CA049B TaxID=2316730 RepID=UPI000EA0AE0E|nr:DNA repair protein RadC [Corallococcus sp. CA049B]NOJ97369.1 DNA repair protein RadC [Corallococcus coralloides]RKG84694.1 DNA repair protein RadC [Corallococcus sp. CA049B]
MEQGGEAWAEPGEGEATGGRSVRARSPGLGDARERLFRLGAEALTDLELLGLLWTEGLGDAADGVAKGGLKALVQEDPRVLCARRGVGPARTSRLLAALELGRRAQRSAEKRPRLRNPKEVHAYLAPTLGALRREVFHVLCFNPRNVLVQDARVAEGTLSACPVDPREVFAAVLASRATAIVFAHNHPSGDPEPSVQDVGLTEHLARAAGILGVKLLDHVVVGDGAFVSMLERGILPDSEREGRRKCVSGGSW